MRRVRFSSVATLLGGAAASGLLLAACQHYGQPKTVAEVGGEPIPDKIDYNWDVRPILSSNCFYCHGNDPKHRRAGLRLDIGKGGAFSDLPENPGKRAIVPGDPRKSELLQRILTKDAEMRMPPRDSHKVISARDIAVLERWIKQGAKYKGHWSLLPVVEAKPARTEWDKQAANQIDRYVFAKLKQKGMAPSKEADRETLINRVSLDLTGLPPTLAQVDAFVADTRPDAYERLVDRLLASTAYAERQSQAWLDVARYADSDGYLNDGEGRFQHPYRDWVISAFKRNIPYDRFVTWQLAGDLMPNPTREQVLATAFIRAGKKSTEGGLIEEEYRVEYVNERTEMFGQGFLGITVGCGKCHDHKYDPFTHADYYSLGGFFNSIDEKGAHSGGGHATPMGPTQAWPTPNQARDLAAASAVTAQKQAAYQQALAAARVAAAPDVDRQIKAGQQGAFLSKAIDADTQGYYPLDSEYKASFEPLMIGPTVRPRGIPGPGEPASTLDLVRKLKPGQKLPTARPIKASGEVGSPFGRQGAVQAAPDPALPHLAGEDVNKAMKDALDRGLIDTRLADPQAIRQRQLMVGLKQDQLAWTPSGRKGDAPGVVNNVKVVDGPQGKGKAIELSNSVFFVAKDVGQFERTDPYTLDVWVKLRADKPYESAAILYNSTGSRGSGYELNLVNNHLAFDVAHLQPYNMISVASVDELPKGRWLHVTATYDGNSKASGVRLYLDGRPLRTEVERDRLTRSAKARGGHSLFGSYYGLAAGANFGRNELMKGQIDEVRILKRALAPVEVAYLHDQRAATELKPQDLRAQMIEIAAAKSPAAQAAWAALTEARLAEQRVETPIYQMMVAGDTSKPRTNYVLDRGLYNVYQGTTPTQGPSGLYPWNSKLPRNRLGLAQWLFDPKHPLTARVTVNRMWKAHFGQGIVTTIEDFGTQGASPTNPELLDYLAKEFVRSGWDVRHMHKLMVMSAAYRQDSTISKDNLEKDPKNYYLARGPRFRLPAEAIRDNALFASGLLLDKVGGDSVFPYQPVSTWDGAAQGLTLYPTEVPDDQMHRRTVYTFMKRTAPFPSLAVFDMPDRTVSSVSRPTSNTPLQALVLLNDVQFNEAYRKLAERALKSGGTTDQQIAAMFRLAVRRRPLDKELAAARAFHQQELAKLARSPEEVKRLLSIGVAPVDPGVDPVKLAALTVVTAAVMNTPDAYTLR